MALLNFISHPLVPSALLPIPHSTHQPSHSQYRGFPPERATQLPPAILRRWIDVHLRILFLYMRDMTQTDATPTLPYPSNLLPLLLLFSSLHPLFSWHHYQLSKV